MQIHNTPIEGLKIIEPDVFKDNRGYFFEPYNSVRYRKAGIDDLFVQDGLSYSRKDTIRGMHFQSRLPQAKIVQVFEGEIFDVCVDIRPGEDFGKWYSITLSATNHRQLYIPVGLAHGFCVLSKKALVSYHYSHYYDPTDTSGIMWNDPDIGINWPIDNPILSKKDKGLGRLKDYGHSK